MFFFPLDKRPFFISSCGYGASQWGITLVKSNPMVAIGSLFILNVNQSLQKLNAMLTLSN